MTTCTGTTRRETAQHGGRTAAALLTLACAAGAAAAGEISAAAMKPMLILDERLELGPVQVSSISQATLQQVDNRGQIRASSIANVLALLPRSFDRGAEELVETPSQPAAAPAAPPAPAAPARPGEASPPAAGPQVQAWVTLVDGQRIVGDPEPDAAQEDALAWRHETLGPLVFRLERIRRIVFVPEPGQNAAAPLEPAGADDVVVLRNGDRLTGFVVSVQPEIAIESGGQTVTIPGDRVARVELVNEPELARGTHLWLTDGTRIGVHSLAQPGEEDDAGGLKLHLESPSESPLSETRSISLHELTAIAFDAGRLAALTDLEIDSYEPAELRRTSRPPVVQRGGADPLGAGDVLLPGPMSVEWTLPEGALRVAGWVTLPASAFVWGDCNVTVETLDEAGEPTETARAHLRGMTPTVRINEDLPPDAVRLRVRLEAGEYGAVQDRVLLQRFILLTEPE